MVTLASGDHMAFTAALSPEVNLHQRGYRFPIPLPCPCFIKTPGPHPVHTGPYPVYQNRPSIPPQ